MSKPFNTPHRLAVGGRANAVPAPRYSAKPEPVFPVSTLTGEYRLSQIGAEPAASLVGSAGNPTGEAGASNLPKIDPSFAWREEVSLLIYGALSFAGTWFGMALASGMGAL